MDALLISREEIEAVAVDFRKNINQWCELTSRTRKIPQEQMCQVAIQTFGHKYAPTWISKCIDQKFKVGYKSQNASQKKASKSQKLNKIMKLAKSLGFEVVKSIDNANTPAFETLVLFTKEDG